MTNRLKPLMNNIISEEQTGFVPGRSILDGVIIAQEAIHTLQSTNRPGMIIKLDITKAYDSVDWRVLCKTLQAFGFDKHWINWVFECISTPKFSILVNGNPTGFSSSSRGIRQGYPLSPFLYIIMGEALGRAIKASHANQQLGVKITKDFVATHQQFADNNLLLGSTNVKEAKHLNQILEMYGRASGQQRNKHKLKFSSSQHQFHFRPKFLES